MPRKFFKRISPHPDSISKHGSLGWLSKFMHLPELWSFKRANITMAIAIGLFCAMLPIPFQMVLAAYFAYLLAANLPISVALVWVSNPLTMPAIFFAQYKVGSWLLGDEVSRPSFELSVEWFYQQIGVIWQPFLLGVLIFAVVLSGISFLIVNRLWVWKVKHTWRNGRFKKID